MAATSSLPTAWSTIRRRDRFYATGGARLEEPEGNIVIAETVRLSDDSEGRLPRRPAGRHHLPHAPCRRPGRSARRAITVFEDAGYTACYTCRRRPDNAPTWADQGPPGDLRRGRSARCSSRSAQFDLFGNTVAVLPDFSIPDPTVRRKSGFLMPTFVGSNLLGVRRARALLPDPRAQRRTSPSRQHRSPGQGLFLRCRVSPATRERRLHGARHRHLPARPRRVRGSGGNRNARGSRLHHRRIRHQSRAGVGAGNRPSPPTGAISPTTSRPRATRSTAPSTL